MVGTKIDMLKLGADDYITKPFDLGEVVARVESNLRRSGKQLQGGRNLQYKDLELNDHSKRVAIQGAEIELTPRNIAYWSCSSSTKGKYLRKRTCMNPSGRMNI